MSSTDASSAHGFETKTSNENSQRWTGFVLLDARALHILLSFYSNISMMDIISILLRPN